MSDEKNIDQEAGDGDGGGEAGPVVNVAVKPAGQPRERGGRAKAFSETQWFMKGAEMDADLLETVEEEEYDRDEKISEEDRKGHTLRDTE